MKLIRFRICHQVFPISKIKEMNDITSPKTIDNLPDEVLVEIFVYLSPKMLKVVTLVCSR